MITRRMLVEERLERVTETLFELRQKNGNLKPDDRMTLVVSGESTPRWKAGETVTVTIEEA